MSGEPDYLTIAPAVEPGKYCVLLMRYIQREDEYVIGKSSQALPETAAKTLLESWQAALKLEVRLMPHNSDSDSLPPPHPLDKMIAEIEGSTTASLMEQSGEQFMDLMAQAVGLFDSYSLVDQTVALSAMLGMAIASMEGQPVSYESQHGLLLTYEDRIRIHTATIRMVAKEAIAAAAANGEKVKANA